MKKTLYKRLQAAGIASALLLSNVLMPVQTAFADRPQNNAGDIKVHEPGSDSELNNNTPHLSSCTVQVDFYNFNNNSPISASVAFTPQSPTSNAGISVTGDTNPIIEGDGDADGQGNNDLDGAYLYTLAFTGNPSNSGYKVKLDVEVSNGNGGSKTKVFWMPASCRATVAATAPTYVDLCETEDDTYTIPATDNVIYEVNNVTKAANTYSTNGASSITIKAYAVNGYQLAGQDTWTFNYTNNANCEVEVAMPQPPTFIDECGLDNVMWNANSYSDTDAYYWVVNQDGSLTVHTNTGYEFVGGATSKTYYLPQDNGIKCATPADPTKIDTCGVKNDTYTIPATEGIDYQIDGQTVAAGTYAATSDLTIKAVAQNGYELVGANEWTLAFTNEYCEPDVTMNLYTYCDADGQVFLLRAHNPTDSDQMYEFVIRDSEGTIVEQDVATLPSGEYTYASWTADTEDTYTFEVYSYNGNERGALLWETMVTTKCATDVFTPEIYKRDQFGNLLPGAKFTIEICQWLPESEGWSCQTYYNVDLGSYTSGEWFSTIEYEKYVPTVVTVTETSTLPACTLVSEPWVFTWDYDEEEMQYEKLLVEMPKATTPYNSGSWSVEQPWNLENECTTGNGGTGETPEDPATPTVTEVVQELPHTGPGGTLTTLVALLGALVTYGAVYFAQPKRQLED